MTNEELNTALYHKMFAEQERFKAYLLTVSPHEVLEQAYEYVCREDILLAMPSRFKCSETCKGICPGCGANLNREKCRCSAKKKKNKKDNPADNVWGALDQLKL